MKPSFASKEFPFLKNDSDMELAGPPAQYLSDLIAAPTTGITAFTQRLETADIPKNKFVCAVIRAAGPVAPEDRDKVHQCLESTFQLVLQSGTGKETAGSGAEKTSSRRRGIWERLTEDVFVLAFWDYDRKPQAKSLLQSLKKNLAAALDRGILMGRAWYPNKKYSPVQTFHNALKALDHAAFFNDNRLQDFDETSVNISADRKYQMGAYQAAVEEYQEGLVMNAGNINMLNSLGVCFGITNQLEKASEQFRKTLDLAPEDIMVLYNMGLIYHIQKKGQKAIAYLTKAHSIQADIYEVELLLGRLLCKEGQEEKALSHLETAANLKEETSVPLRLQGDIFLNQKDPKKAAQMFNQAVKRNPQDAAALSGYAIAMAEQGKNLGIAVSFARQSLALAPNNKLFANRLSKIVHLQEEKNYKEPSEQVETPTSEENANKKKRA